MEFFYLAIGLFVGAIIVWLGMKSRLTRQNSVLQQKLAESERLKQDEINSLDKEKSILNEKYINFQESNEKLNTEVSAERSRNKELTTLIATSEADYKNLKEKLDHQKTELEEMQKKLTMHFENIANKILKNNSLEFTQVNKKNINELLNPLRGFTTFPQLERIKIV